MSQNDRRNLLPALIEIGQELASTIDLEALLNSILRISKEVFQFENAIIRLFDPGKGVLVTAAAFGYAEEAVRPEIRPGQGVMGRAFQIGEPVLVQDVSELPDYLPGIRGALSELAVPMISRDRTVGVINVESPRSDAFSEDDIPPLMTMASQAAIAIENARLYDDLRTVSAHNRELNQFNSRILRSVSLGIYTVDADLTITSWNRRMEEMSEVSAAEATGRPLLELFPNLEEEGVGERIRRVLERGMPEKLRLTHRNLRGQLRFQKRRLAPLKDQEETTGVVVIVEDVTEFKQLLDQIIQSEKLAEVGRLSAGIAHEINNPLAVISYGAQLLRREESLEPFQRDLVERIETETERLKALSGSLLSFSSPREMVKKATDLNEVIKDVLRLVRFELNRKSLQVKEHLDNLPPIQADANKLKQVFINLLINASQAVDAKDGIVSISTRVINGEEVEVAVQDNGPGIPEKIREQIFTPFFTTKKDGEGTGLGLYICRNLVREHNGRLLVENGSGRGTVFRVVLPTA